MKLNVQSVGLQEIVVSASSSVNSPVSRPQVLFGIGHYKDPKKLTIYLKWMLVLKSITSMKCYSKIIIRRVIDFYNQIFC